MYFFSSSATSSGFKGGLLSLSTTILLLTFLSLSLLSCFALLISILSCLSLSRISLFFALSSRLIAPCSSFLARFGSPLHRVVSYLFSPAGRRTLLHYNGCPSDACLAACPDLFYDYRLLFSRHSLLPTICSLLVARCSERSALHFAGFSFLAAPCNLIFYPCSLIPALCYSLIGTCSSFLDPCSWPPRLFHMLCLSPCLLHFAHCCLLFALHSNTISHDICSLLLPH